MRLEIDGRAFGERQVLKVRNLDAFDFQGWDIGLFSPGASVSADWAVGCWLTTSTWSSV